MADFEGPREEEDEEGRREEREEAGKRREGKEEEKREEEEDRAREEGDEQVLDDTNDVAMTSRSSDHLSTTTNDRSVGPHDLPTPTTSPEPVPTNPSAHPESVQPPGLWCDPVTVTLEQIEEKTRRLLREWPKDDGVPFPMEVLEMLRVLKTKVRSRDEEKTQIMGPLTMADPPADATLGAAKTTMRAGQAKGEMDEERTTKVMYTDAHPTDESTGRTPTPLDWAKDVDESVGLNPVSTDTKSTVRVEKPTAEPPVVPTPPVAYGPRDLSALCSGTRNPWGTLSRRHHRHRRSQSPCDPSTPNSTTRATWNGSRHPHRRFYRPPPRFDPLPNPTPTYVVETVRHPQGIAPTKPVIRTMSPVRHNAPRAPVRLVSAIHLPQKASSPSGHTT